MPLDYWKDRFQTANPSQYHQFKNKTPEKKDQMATAALYKARQPNNENFVAEDAMMGKIEDSGKIVRILKKAHTVPFSDEKNWLLVDMDPAKGNSGLGIKWIPADTKFTWVRPYRDSVDENFADGKNPQDKGDSKRHGVPTKSSVSNLRKVAKQGGRKGQLAHWMANMKAGRAKK